MMKFYASFALRGLVIASCLALCASQASAFSGLNDGSFFAGQALTMGEMPKLASPFVQSETNGQYGECASCAGNAAPAPVADFVPEWSYGGIAAAPVYDDFGFVDSGFIYSDPFVDFGARPVKPVRTALRKVGRPVANVLRSVRDFLFGGGYNYCQPAYVCDPCWSVCDPCWTPCEPCLNVCDPCWTPCAPCAVAPCAVAPCAPCGLPDCGIYAPSVVYAPRGCCGDGFYPGEVHELDPKTALPRANNGIDSKADADVAKPAPKRLATPEESEPAAPAVPAVPEYNDAPADLDAPESEIIPTPAANPTLGSGVIKMLVPEDSIVYVNGYRTKKTGALRVFAAQNLEYGESYTFEIRVVESRNGRVFEDVQTTVLTAGETSALAFNLTPRDEMYALSAAK